MRPVDSLGSASLVCLLVGCVRDDVTAACLTFLGVKVNALWRGRGEI